MDCAITVANCVWLRRVSVREDTFALIHELDKEFEEVRAQLANAMLQKVAYPYGAGWIMSEDIAGYLGTVQRTGTSQ